MVVLRWPVEGRRCCALAAAAVLCGPLALAQPVLPPDALQQFQKVVGDRIEAVNILAGDYAAAGGVYAFRGGSIADLSITKLGGGGAVASPKPLGLGSLQWAPVLQGNVGWVSAENQFETGYLAGNRMNYDTLAIEGGGGVVLFFNEHLSLSPTLSGIYGRVQNTFNPHNGNGYYVKSVGSGKIVDWTIDTWSVVPALELDYQLTWGRTIFEFSSHYDFFHTDSFESSSPLVNVKGNSSTWENKLDVDVPLSLKLFGRELHTGGFISRTELFGDAAGGLNTEYVYTANGRLVLDFLGKVWKLRWLGLGYSYFWGQNFNGWSVGADVRFKF
jgi:hypothetical protein